MRKVIVIYETFSKTKYKGTFIVIIAQDGNNYQYPIALAVVDYENNNL